MATVKALGGHTVHQIQSGQVIVDLCSVVKELVENSLDAGATSIEVRFRNHGLDAIEVQDNGNGISSDDYETIALKHYTSKLSSYDDLSSLQTFGFRGEALSSLCALSNFYVTTARVDEAPKGTKLDFDVSGKLKGTQVVASQKGSTVTVEDIFRNLPVRRRELEKSIKREYGKALSILQAYACISTQARISVSNVMGKGKKTVAFATRSSPTTRDNIANVFGAKALPGFVPMDLAFEMRPTRTFSQLSDPENKQVRVVGHVSKPAFGEGRQAPDRQMFFVNSRPCALPQIAKIFNEVYRSYNVSQSPFVFANLILDTNAYDVNVSPDKRTILLHEQNVLLNSLRTSLTELFKTQDQSMPISQSPAQRLPLFKQLTVHRENSGSSRTEVQTINEDAEPTTSIEASDTTNDAPPAEVNHADKEPSPLGDTTSLIENFVGRDSRERISNPISGLGKNAKVTRLSKEKQNLVKKLSREDSAQSETNEAVDGHEILETNHVARGPSTAVDDFNDRIAEQQKFPKAERMTSDDIGSEENVEKRSGPSDPRSSSIIQNAFDRMRPRRKSPEVATITIGSKTMTSILGSSPTSRFGKGDMYSSPTPRKNDANKDSRAEFSSSMRSFVAPGSQPVGTVDRPQRKVHKSVDYSIAGVDRDNSVSDCVSSDSGDGTSDLENDDEIQVASQPQNRPSPEFESDQDYVDENERKTLEEARIAELIRQAEEAATLPSEDQINRAHQVLKGAGQKSSTTHLVQVIDASIKQINEQLDTLAALIQHSLEDLQMPNSVASTSIANTTPEEHLSLTVSKADFASMHTVGQFNLGFILTSRDNADLFIVDQHASDEKYNFERLQAITVVQNQRLVQPRVLDLTAIEEEIVFEHNEAFIKNGFLVDTDTSGEVPVGQRCKLVSLPMSREVIFDISDLEELISLLSDSSASSLIESVPRPSKVRRMFAMRACRSSVMVGKTLTLKQMGNLVRKMGGIDKPWNCPHGRPTMRHVRGLEGWEVWSEGDGLVGLNEEPEAVDWHGWISDMKNRHSEMDSEGDQEEEEDEEMNEKDEEADE